MNLALAVWRVLNIAGMCPALCTPRAMALSGCERRAIMLFITERKNSLIISARFSLYCHLFQAGSLQNRNNGPLYVVP